jgi:hypothetical protein
MAGVKSKLGWLAPVVIVVICGVLGLVVVGCNGRGPLSRLGLTELELQPQSAARLGEGGDPLIIMIGVRWTKEGWCSGQFTVHGTETATEVHVSNVISREYRYGSCAGLGTLNNMAWADLRLSAPLGNRVVIRNSDGARLPVATF